MRDFISECENTLHWTIMTNEFGTDTNTEAIAIAEKYKLIIATVSMANMTPKCTLYPYLYCAYRSVKVALAGIPAKSQYMVPSGPPSTP
jgi:hypothetical protein